MLDRLAGPLIFEKKVENEIKRNYFLETVQFQWTYLTYCILTL